MRHPQKLSWQARRYCRALGRFKGSRRRPEGLLDLSKTEISVGSRATGIVGIRDLVVVLSIFLEIPDSGSRTLLVRGTDSL